MTFILRLTKSKAPLLGLPLSTDSELLTDQSETPLWLTPLTPGLWCTIKRVRDRLMDTSGTFQAAWGTRRSGDMKHHSPWNTL